MSPLIRRISATMGLLWLVALGGCASHARPQAAPGPTPVMLRRVAEAVEGHRTGAPVWVVVGSAAPNAVVGVRDRRADADALQRATGFPTVVLGPFQSPRDPAGAGRLLISCHRAGDTADGPTACSAPVRLDDVQSIEIVIGTRTGETRRFDIPEGVDAAFLSPESIQQFVIPYYTRVLGLAAAQRIWVDFGNGMAAGGAGIRDTLPPQPSPGGRRPRIPRRVLAECIHDKASNWDSRGMCPRAILSLAHIESITLVTRESDGEVVSIPLPLTTDVVLFSLSALDKFVIPHVVSTEGPDAAAARRQGLIDQLTDPRSGIARQEGSERRRHEPPEP